MESSRCPFLLLNAKQEIEPRSSVSVTDARLLIGEIFFFFIQQKLRYLITTTTLLVGHTLCFFVRKVEKKNSHLNYQKNKTTQAQHPDSVTGGGGAEINFGGARKVYLYEFERGTGGREIYPSLDQTNKVKTKKKVFIEIQRDFPAEIRNSNSFSGRKQVTSKQNKQNKKSFH